MIPEASVRVASKHHALVRVSHWVNVPLLLGLIASGLAIYWAAPVFTHARDPLTGSRDYLADAGNAIGLVLHDRGGEPRNWIYDHLSLGPRQLATALRLHWALAYLFMANGALYLLGLVAGGGWRPLLPRPSDVGGARAMIRFYLGVLPMTILRRPWPHPRGRSKYNALQRAAYFSMPLVGAREGGTAWIAPTTRPRAPRKATPCPRPSPSPISSPHPRPCPRPPPLHAGTADPDGSKGWPSAPRPRSRSPHDSWPRDRAVTSCSSPPERWRRRALTRESRAGARSRADLRRRCRRGAHLEAPPGAHVRAHRGDGAPQQLQRPNPWAGV